MSRLVAAANGSLRKRSIDALMWSAADSGGRQALQFFVSVMLARLLSPAEFGLLGMLSVFLAVAQTFVDSGFGSALIQRKEITEADKSTVFFFNLAAGGLMAACLYLAAPWIAGFYREPLLTELTRFMALNLAIGAFSSMQTSLLMRELDFRTLWKVGMIATVVSGGIAVWMAKRGFGVWSLAVQAVLSTLLTAVLLWMLSPWKPRWTFCMESLRRLFGFGSKFLAACLINTVFDRIQLLLIGKTFSPVQLGYYTRAFGTQQFPVGLLSAIISRVMFPVFSQLSGDRLSLKSGVRRALVSIMIPTLPMMIGLAVLAKPLVLVLFGAKWLPCVPYLRVLSVAGALWPLHIINLNIVTAVGRSDLFLRLEVAKRVIVGVGLLITFRISVMAMVWAFLIAAVACVFVNTHYSKALVGYGLLSQLYDLAPYGGLSALMAVVTWATSSQFPNHAAAGLVSAALSGVVFYCTSCHFLRLEGYRSALASALAIFSSDSQRRSDRLALVQRGKN